MRKFKNAVKTTAKAGLIAADGINMGTIKVLGIALNTTSNAITSGIDILQAKLDGVSGVTFWERLKAANKRDDYLMRVIDGREPIEDYARNTLPDWMFDAIMKNRDVKTDAFGPMAKSFDELDKVFDHG